MHCPRGLVAYEGCRCRGDFTEFLFEDISVFGFFTRILHHSIVVYVVLFGTNGAHNCGGLRVVRGCNLENDFGASGWIPNETEVSVCILH